MRTEDGDFIAELFEPNQRILLAPGGRGGKGNEAFKRSSDNAPTYAELGEVVKPLWLHIELKLVADVGFVGVPNAGKSTLLARSR